MIRLKEITGVLDVNVPVTVVDTDTGFRETIPAGKSFDWDVFNPDALVEEIDMSGDREFDELVLLMKGLLKNSTGGK